LVFASLFYGNLNAQTIYALEGRLFNKSDSSFVPASNVYTMPGNKGNMSDPNGYFYMEITEEDTLYVSTIGFKTYKILCLDLIENNDLRIHIFLEPKIYQLEEFNVLGSLTYEEFKAELLELPLAEEQMIDFDIPWEWYGYSNMPASGGFGLTFNGIFSGLYDKYGKEGKQRQKIQEIEQQKGTRDYIFNKYNPYVIQRATGIDNEDEIVSFMEFCKFSDYFIVNAKEEELGMALAKKYKIYKAIESPSSE
jgi:hypothetical protein